ncbi:hypothetical protein [Streptomyces olindensis]
MGPRPSRFDAAMLYAHTLLQPDAAARIRAAEAQVAVAPGGAG